MTMNLVEKAEAYAICDICKKPISPGEFQIKKLRVTGGIWSFDFEQENIGHFDCVIRYIKEESEKLVRLLTEQKGVKE